MTWQRDLEPCDYFGAELSETLIAVGWLERSHPYPAGEVDRSVFERLVELSKSPWQPLIVAGIHSCDLCVYTSEAVGQHNLFIPGDGIIFVCPDLVSHYMNAHSYAPPASFCQAVLTCPPMGSMEYKKSLLANGGRRLVQFRSS